MASVFAYGTLAVPAVMEAVTGQRLPRRPAVVRGFARHRLRGRAYPGAAPAAGASLPGILWAGVDAATLARLDRFEGTLYERCRVPVEGGGTAELYVIAEPHRAELLPEPWDEGEFVSRHLASWVERCAAFRREDEARGAGARAG